MDSDARSCRAGPASQIPRSCLRYRAHRPAKPARPPPPGTEDKLLLQEEEEEEEGEAEAEEEGKGDDDDDGGHDGDAGGRGWRKGGSEAPSTAAVSRQTSEIALAGDFKPDLARPKQVTRAVHRCSRQTRRPWCRFAMVPLARSAWTFSLHGFLRTYPPSPAAKAALHWSSSSPPSSPSSSPYYPPRLLLPSSSEQIHKDCTLPACSVASIQRFWLVAPRTPRPPRVNSKWI